MGGIERFEEIEAWKEARSLARAIYEATRLPAFAKDVELRQQMRRACVSVMANNAEGFGAASNQEFLRFLSHALRSTTELQSHLYVALDKGYLDPRRVELLHKQAGSVKNLIGGFIRYLRGHSRSKTGSKRGTLNREL